MSSDDGQADPPATLEVGKWRSTTITIPEQLDERVSALRATVDRSRGEVIIDAIEQELPGIESRRKSATVGGTLFAARPASGRAASRTDHTRPFAFRLHPDDFVVLDRLYQQHGFSSRKALIVACLDAYCDRQGFPG